MGCGLSLNVSALTPVGKVESTCVCAAEGRQKGGGGHIDTLTYVHMHVFEHMPIHIRFLLTRTHHIIICTNAPAYTYLPKHVIDM